MLLWAHCDFFLFSLSLSLSPRENEITYQELIQIIAACIASYSSAVLLQNSKEFKIPIVVKQQMSGSNFGPVRVFVGCLHLGTGTL